MAHEDFCRFEVFQMREERVQGPDLSAMCGDRIPWPRADEGNIILHIAFHTGNGIAPDAETVDTDAAQYLLLWSTCRPGCGQVNLMSSPGQTSRDLAHHFGHPIHLGRVG